MTQPLPRTDAAPPAGLLARLGRRFGGPLEWSNADKCLIVGLLVFGIGTLFVAWEIYALQRPGLVAFLDYDMARKLLPIHVAVYEGGWIAIILAALWCRKRAPRSRLLVHVTVQAYAIGFAFVSYQLGHFSSNYLAAVLMGGVAVGFLLFEPRPVLASVCSAVAVVLATTIAEQAGLIPYAPLLAKAPFEGGHISGWWIASIGAGNATVLLVVVIIIHQVFSRWRAREREVSALAGQLSLANELISRYIAAQLAEKIRAGRYDDIDRQVRRRLTLFFSDIKDFSEIADRIAPEDLSAMLNDYLAEMTAIGERYGATIDKFVGDAIMIFFGAPSATSDEDHALRAVRMAVDMQRRIAELEPKWRREASGEAFQVRMGINTGDASVGNFGSKGRLDYTAIGRHVNLAARLQSLCAPGRVLISESTWLLVKDQIPCIPKGELRVKGFRDPVVAYEVSSNRCQA